MCHILQLMCKYFFAQLFYRADTGFFIFWLCILTLPFSRWLWEFCGTREISFWALRYLWYPVVVTFFLLCVGQRTRSDGAVCQLFHFWKTESPFNIADFFLHTPPNPIHICINFIFKIIASWITTACMPVIWSYDFWLFLDLSILFMVLLFNCTFLFWLCNQQSPSQGMLSCK